VVRCCFGLLLLLIFLEDDALVALDCDTIKLSLREQYKSSSASTDSDASVSELSCCSVINKGGNCGTLRFMLNGSDLGVLGGSRNKE